MKLRATFSAGDKVDLQMTPMIDIVFQLLVFFVLTFKIVAVEGDFSIKMPLVGVGVPATPLPSLRVRLSAGEDGELSQLTLDNRPLADFRQLHEEMQRIMESGGRPSAMSAAEVELDCDHTLDYRYVVDALTAVTGYIKDGEIRPLATKVRFASPRRRAK